MLNRRMLSRHGDKLLGLIPLLSMIWTTMLYLKEGRTDELLWICNVSNFLLGISLLLSWAPGIWTSTLWILVGTPLWILDAVKASNFEAHSFFTHFVSSAIGVIACQSHRVDKSYWWKASILLPACQLLSRVFTRPVYNVNVVYAPYGTQMSYATYWVLCGLGLGLALFTTEWFIHQLHGRLLWRVLPSKRSA